jgi:hypothetical protein
VICAAGLHLRAIKFKTAYWQRSGGNGDVP